MMPITPEKQASLDASIMEYAQSSIDLLKRGYRDRFEFLPAEEQAYVESKLVKIEVLFAPSPPVPDWRLGDGPLKTSDLRNEP